MKRPSGKEIYAACLVLLIGVIYLAAQTDSLFSIGSTSVKGDSIKISKNEFLSHTRTIITIVLCIAGGLLLLLSKRAGWVIAQSILLLLLTIACGILISNIHEVNTLGSVVVGSGILLLLLAIIFLFQNKTRQKLMITARSYLFVFILFSILAVFYFFLQ